MHLVPAPGILEEAGGYYHDPAVAVLDSLTELSHNGTAWCGIPHLQEATEGLRLTLQVGDHLLDKCKIPFVVTNAHIIAFGPAGTS